MRIKLGTIAVGMAVMLAGCSVLPFGYTNIGDIVAAPAQFEGKEVKLKGTVMGALQVPIVELKSYTLRDDTGEIAVLTRTDVPAAQQTVSITGVVKSLAIIGGQSLGLRVEERERN